MTRPILIVDDDELLRDAIAAVLETQNIACLSASNGQEALDVMRKDLPGLLLLDLQMPVLDGAGVVQCLQHWGIDVPIVLMSATAPSLARSAQEFGITHLLPKPFGFADLLSTVDRALAGAGGPS